ncbi:DNA repair protein RecO [Gaetbulibacter saemankumensis]|uniref:DNA repair protein RecO n=1 Tax=Gaetbulibacter saemankumensis TaxID=311208 RepID=UPI000421EF43|nr:DNA repair protein RecO [Gaetbulibacter saemankumensis]
MQVSTRAIVLSKLKFKDNDLIVRCYTEQLGIVSFLIRGVFKSHKSNNKLAYFQLLSQLELNLVYKGNRSLQVIKDTKIGFLYNSLQSNVFKSSIVMFLSEALSSALKEEEQNETLYRYLETSLQWLDSQDDYANFHLLFLLNLTKYLGFYPDVSDIDYHYFDLSEGRFVETDYGRYTISGENITVLKRLLHITFEDLPDLKISSKQRQSFLNMILLYFELHLGSFSTPKSLQIFNQVFS